MYPVHHLPPENDVFSTSKVVSVLLNIPSHPSSPDSPETGDHYVFFG
jgi:hypothetical protein